MIGGTIVLFDRTMLRNFRKDGHNWKKKKDGKTVKEAHEHLKVSLPLSGLDCVRNQLLNRRTNCLLVGCMCYCVEQ